MCAYLFTVVACWLLSRDIIRARERGINLRIRTGYVDEDLDTRLTTLLYYTEPQTRLSSFIILYLTLNFISFNKLYNQQLTSVSFKNY